MGSLIVQYLAAAVLFLALDAPWLALMSKRLYRPNIGEMMRDAPAWGWAVLFYLVYIACLTALAVAPGVAANAPGTAAINGALVGLAGYGTYNLTNAATLKRWPLPVVLFDTLWGVIATTLTAWLATVIVLRFGG
jgi:uncharacterized membrane protein